MEPVNTETTEPAAQTKNENTLIPLTKNVVSSISWKLFVILFFIYILISSDVFVRYVLAKCPDAVEGNTPTTTGRIVQGGVLVGLGIVSSLLINNSII